MSKFTFTGTAQCDVCGNFLDSSEAECDHDGQLATEHMFRHTLSSFEPRTISVESTAERKWMALQDIVGGDWIGYQYLGSKSRVKSMLGRGWDSIDDVPRISMPMHAPEEARSYVDE